MQNISSMADFVNHTKISNTVPVIKPNIQATNVVNNAQNNAPAVVNPPVNNVSVEPQTIQGAETAQAAPETPAQAPVQNVQTETKAAAQTATVPSEDAPKIKPQPANDTVELTKQLNNAKRKNGLIEKAYDKIKNVTGLGIGSKKIQEAIDSGKDAKEIEQQISDYRVSEERAAQSFGDVLSILAAGGAFFVNRNQLTEFNAGRNLKNKSSFIGMAADSLVKNKNTKAGNMGKMTVVLALSAALAGGLVKSIVMKLNGIGSQRYKIDKNNDFTKEELRKERQYLKAEKRSANFKNFMTGAINGLLMPVITTAGAVIGTPLYLAGNLASRYFIAENNDEDSKTPVGLVKSIAKNPITSAVTAALIAIPLFKTGKFSNVLAKNYDTVVNNLNNSKLTSIGTGKTAYQKLEEILLGDSSVRNITHSWSLSVEEKIQRLTDENIFAIKFEQIRGSEAGALGKFFGVDDSLVRALKENCPPSRTMKEAQKLVSKTFGKQYKLEKCLGVGTVAETYLAKDANGNEVCIKMLKNGIDAKKIETDKKKFLDIIKAHFEGQPDKKDEMDFMIQNMENIADGIAKEIDFNNEMEAARKLAKHTTKAKVVQPIEVKDGLYVMEKADGISLESFIKLNELYTQKRKLEAGSAALKDVEEQIAAIKAKTPSFKNVDLDKDDADYLLQQYMDVLVEQFSKTEKGGKTIHGDIHPGNIFINADALRSRKGNVFTLIDTGNTIEQTAERAVRVINLQKYMKNADVENLAAYILDGAKLPKGMSKEKAFELVQKELSDIFFNNKTAIDKMHVDELTKITDNIMQKLNIVPSDAQGALFKAKQSAETSLSDLRNTIVHKILSGIISGDEGALADTANWGKIEAMHAAKKANQERANLKKLSPVERARIKISKSAPKKNSVEYLTYKLKQQVKATGDKKTEPIFDF